MALTKFQKAALEVLKARLDTSDPGHRAAREVSQAFDGPARAYLQTWILPLLDAILNGPERAGSDYWQERAVASDHAAVAHAREAAKRGAVTVTFYKPGMSQAETIGRFATIGDAERYLATGARINPDDLAAGHYGIDAPDGHEH